MTRPIKIFRKRKARKISKSRTPRYVKGEEKGTTSTVLMKSYEGENKRGKKRYYVAPSIDNEGGQSFSEAKERGEVFQFRSKRKAEKFSFGMWKKGKDKKEARKEWKQYKKENYKKGGIIRDMFSQQYD